MFPEWCGGELNYLIETVVLKPTMGEIVRKYLKIGMALCVPHSI